MRIPRADDPRDSAGSRSRPRMRRDWRTRPRPLLEQATGVEWYELPGNDVDRAALDALPATARDGRAVSGGPQHGDEAVRVIARRGEPEALVWLASRAISYMDENGFPRRSRRGSADDLVTPS